MVAQLQDEVVRRYVELDLPAWPDPHPGGEPPRDDEYSRETDPDRYRIAHVRGRTWADVLHELTDAAIETIEVDARHHGTRVTCSRPGALPLLLLEREDPPGLRVSALRPDVVVAEEPYCGCDACDDGSAYLLRMVDEAVARIVGGPWVAMQGDWWSSQWHPGGFESGGSPGSAPDHQRLLELSRRLADGEETAEADVPAGVEIVVSRSWLS